MWNKRTAARQRGFTIVEVIVATTILSIGLLATVAVGNNSVNISTDNQRKAEAVNIARQGLELVRNIRDTNWQVYETQVRVQQATGSGLVRTTSDWDCYPSNAADATALGGASCDASRHFIATGGGADFVLHLPLLPDGTPADGTAYLTPGASSSTGDASYRLCANVVSGATYYIPVTDLPTCSQQIRFYRRIRISVANLPTSGTEAGQTVKVESRVNYGERGANDVILEEYITNWKRFR